MRKGFFMYKSSKMSFRIICISLVFALIVAVYLVRMILLSAAKESIVEGAFPPNPHHEPRTASSAAKKVPVSKKL